jgi:tetratricopeptide (TPR) repeat protein
MSNTNQNKTDNLSTGAAKKRNFIAENQKSLFLILSGVVVLVFLYIGYQQFYLAPRESKAADQMYRAELYATVDSMRNRAIEGDGSYPGFKEISEAYDNTKSANIANAYLGGLYLREGKYQEAIQNLEKFSDTGSQLLDALVVGMIGDAYSELKDYKNAATFYKKAADKNANSFTSPLMLKKLGLVYEAQNEYKSALDAYKQIKSNYPESQESTIIDSYIGRVEAKL